MILRTLAFLVATAQPQSVENPCDSAPAGACRHVGTLHLEPGRGDPVDLPVDQDLPWVTQDNVMLLPGESVTVQLQRDPAGALVPRLVRGASGDGAPAPEAGQVRLSLSPLAGGNITLSVLSRYPETLDYAALIVNHPDRPERTSVCSLMPGVLVMEQWQSPVRQLAVWSFRATTEPGCKTVSFPARP